LSELQDTIIEKEDAIAAQRLEFERKIVMLEKEHDSAMDWLFRMNGGCGCGNVDCSGLMTTRGCRSCVFLGLFVCSLVCVFG
jgi:hypothetical protein